MANTISLNGEARNEFGKGVARRLRVAGKIPAAGGFPQTDLAGELTAVLYGSDIDAVFLRTNGGDKSAEIHRAAGGGKVDQSAAAHQKQSSQQYPFCCVFHEYPSFVLSVA